MLQKKMKEDRSSLITAGMNNLGFLAVGNQEAQQSQQAYKELKMGFKVARSAAVSPSASKLVLPDI